MNSGMYQDRGPSQRYIRRRKSRKSSSMMMFVMAAALLITGGALGTPWLGDFFGSSSASSAGYEAGVACPESVVGLTLTSDGEIRSNGDVFKLECEYTLGSSTTVSAQVDVTWTESGNNGVLARGCGLPPATVPGAFTAEGSYYGIKGQARADYTGRTRYANAMQTLASQLVSFAGSIATPCPSEEVVSSAPGSEDGEGGEQDGAAGSETAGSGQGSETGNGTPSAEATPGASGQPSSTATPTVAVPAGSCLVSGRVTDSRGIAVPLIGISIHDATGNLVSTVATSQAGSYSFSQPVDAAGSVVLTPTDAGRAQPVFRIFAEQAPATLVRQLRDVEVDNNHCEVNFDLWSLDANYQAADSTLDRWTSIVELYQNFNRAAELANVLDAPLEYGLPVPVYAWCDSSELFCDPTGNAEFAFYSGSTTGRTVEQPYIALGFPSSELDYRGTPDNREYHEFGHAFLADVVNNEIPVNVGDLNHGGYYRNEMTTDSFIEGFAEFYSVMVSKHVDQADNPQRYRIGAEYDIEVDRKPWEAVGWWEEFTLAGLLLDFEDGDDDYSRPTDGLDVESVSALSANTGNFAIGRVRNLGGSVAHGPEVTVSLLNSSGETVFTQVTAVKPESLGPGQSGVFYVAAPEGVEFDDVNAVAGRPAGVDDDDIDLELADLMGAVTSNWGASDDRISTVKQLYMVLSDTFAGQDVDNNGAIDATQEQIDQIFIRHGFFDDVNGDNQWDPAVDGEIGGTAHPAKTIGRNDFPERMPRQSAVGFEGSYVTIDTAGLDADLLVQVELPGNESYAYWTSSGTMKPVELAVPSGTVEQAAVTVIAAADGHNPAVAYRTSAQQFHAAVDSGEVSNQPVRSSVQMEQGDPLTLLGSPDDGEGGNRAGTPPWAMIVPIILAAFMLGGGVYFMRRSGPPPANRE